MARGTRVGPGGDRARWVNPENYQPWWATRAALAARLVPDGVSVLEIGEGSGAFRTLVQDRRDYLGADLAPLNPQTLALDLDRDPLPRGVFDYVVMLGVLEYLHFPKQALEKAHSTARRAIFSYCQLKPGQTGSNSPRRERGWLNDFSRDELLATAARAGWRLLREEPFNEYPDFVQAIFLVEHAASTASAI